MQDSSDFKISDCPCVQVKIMGKITLAALLLAVLLSTTAFAASIGDLRLPDAAMHSDRAAVRTLLQQKADVNAAQPDGMTALHWAVRQNDLETTRLLMGAGAKVD